MDFSYLTSCEDITEDDFRSAAASKRNTEIFLQKIEALARPGSGVGKVMFFFARVALRNEELEGTAKHIYQDLALQVTRSRRNRTLFEIRLMHDVGGIYEQLYKVTVWCAFEELLQAARDSENMKPFICLDAREDFLLLEATGAERMNSLAPPAYAEADARYRELEAAGMLKPSQMIPTIPPPDDVPEDPELMLADAIVTPDPKPKTDDRPISDRMLDAQLRGEPFTSLVMDGEPELEPDKPPSGILHAIVEPSHNPPPRKRFDSWAEEAEYLAGREPSLPDEPLDRTTTADEDMARAIGRISLTKVRASDLPYSKRPDTVRPPGDNDPRTDPDMKTLPEDSDSEQTNLDDGWDDVLPIVYPKRKKNDR